MGTKTTYPRKWQFGQGGAGVAQRVPRGGKSLGGAGGRGEGWRGMGTKTTYPRKVAIWVGGPGLIGSAPDFWAEVPGSNPASPTMILMRCRIIVK